MKLDVGNAALNETVKKIGDLSMWSGLHDHKKKCEGWAAFGSLAGSNLGLRGVFRDCALPSRLSKENAAISYEKHSLDKRALPRADPRSADGGDTRQAVGMTFGWWQLGPGEWWHWWERAGLPWGTWCSESSGGQGEMGTWVSSRDS